jgi:hypothetical protein
MLPLSTMTTIAHETFEIVVRLLYLLGHVLLSTADNRQSSTTLVSPATRFCGPNLLTVRSFSPHLPPQHPAGDSSKCPLSVRKLNHTLTVDNQQMLFY